MFPKQSTEFNFQKSVPSLPLQNASPLLEENQEKPVVCWEISECETVASRIWKRPIYLSHLKELSCEMMVCKTREGENIKAAA